MLGAIWYHLFNLKNVKNAHGGVLLLVKLHALAKFVGLFVGKYLAKPFLISYFISEISLLLFCLSLSRRTSLSYRNQSINLLCKSVDWFLYDRDFRVMKELKLGGVFRTLPNIKDEVFL